MFRWTRTHEVPEPSTLKAQPSTLNTQPLTLNTQHSTFNPWRGAPSTWDPLQPPHPNLKNMGFDPATLHWTRTHEVRPRP